MRWPHILKENKTCETPQRALIVGLHTKRRRSHGDSSVWTLQFGCALHLARSSSKSGWTETWYYFQTGHEFWTIIDCIALPKTRTYVCVEHGNTTLQLLDVFTLGFIRGWRWTKVVVECPPTIIQGRRGAASILFIEKANIWQDCAARTAEKPYSLSMSTCDSSTSLEASTSIGANVDAKTKKPAKDGCENDDAKLKRDVQTTSQLWRDWWDFLKKNDLGGFSPTTGSQSVRAFRHRWMHDSILVDCNQEALALARAAYKGGRTECYFIGERTGLYYLVDVNSHYAAVMREMGVPVRLRGYTQYASVDDIATWCRNRVVLCDVTVQTRTPLFAVRENGKLIFPVGKFRCTLAGDEVKAAIQEARIQAVHAVAIYESNHAFKDYMIALWDYRKQAELGDGGREVEKWKMLMRSFYGKWGQSGGVWEKIGTVDTTEIKSWVDVDYHTHKITEYRQFGGIVQELKNEPESRESCPAIAACITANARMVLWDHIECAGRENVFYVDTDSLLVNEIGFRRLHERIRPQDLGGLRLQGQFEHIRINAAKDYEFDHRQRHKGRSPDATELVPGTFQQTETRSLASAIQSGSFGEPSQRIVSRSYNRTYEKGVVGADGTVEPFQRG
jgi:hypothetical protein